MRTFTLERLADESGVSGIGIVLEGTEYSDGTVTVRWITPDAPQSTVMYADFPTFFAIHIAPHPTNLSIVRVSDGWIYDSDGNWYWDRDAENVTDHPMPEALGAPA